MSKFIDTLTAIAVARLEQEKAWASSQWAKIEAKTQQRLQRARARQQRVIRTWSDPGLGGCPA